MSECRAEFETAMEFQVQAWNLRMRNEGLSVQLANLRNEVPSETSTQIS